MKALKIIGIILAILIGLPLIVSLFLPSTVRVERARVINAPKEVLFEEVNTLKNWEKWSPWHRLDPNMKLSYNEIPKGKGATYSWTSEHKNVGNGKLTIEDSHPYDSIAVGMDFMENGKGSANYYFTPEGDAVKVVWTMDSDLENPMMKIVGLFMDKLIGPDFERGLKQLDSVATSEKPMVDDQVKIDTTTVKEAKALGIKSAVPAAEIGKTLSKNYGEILAFMAKNNIKQAGPPYAIYYSHSEQKVEFEACIPVEAVKVKPTGKIIETGIKKGHAVVADYYGDYDNSAIGHIAIDKYLATNNKKLKGSPWEVYITDPVVEKDTSKWHTQIFYPIE